MPTKYRLPVTLFACLLIVGMTGCPGSSNNQGSTAPALPPEEEKFSRLVKDLERTLESSGGGVRNDFGVGAGLRTEGSYSITEQRIIQPTAENENPKAVITFSGFRSLTVIRLKKDAEGEDDEASGKKSDAVPVDPNAGDPAGIPGAELPPVGGTPSAPKPRMGGITQNTKKFDKKFELEFVEGNWKLLTEIDPEVDSFLNLAFKHAIKFQ